MERIRSALRSSFRSSKLDKRGAPIVATDTEVTDGDHEVIPSVLANCDTQAAVDALRSGSCVFLVKYYGSAPVSEPRGIALCRDAMKEVRRHYRKLNRPGRDEKRSLTLRISGKSIRLVNERSQTLLMNESFDRVAFCMADRSHRRAFCFISRDSTSDAWALHAFKTESRRGTKATPGERVCHAIGSAFESYSTRDKVQFSGSVARTDATDTGDAFAISITNQSGAAKLSPIAEEESTLSSSKPRFDERQSATTVPLRREGETPRRFSETEEEHAADDFENESSALLLRGGKIRNTIAVTQAQPPKRPPPFSRNAAERRTIQTDSSQSAASNVEPTPTKSGSLRLSLNLKLPSLKKSRQGDESRKSSTKSGFKRQRSGRLLSGSESTEEDAPEDVTARVETHSVAQSAPSASKNGQTETVATRVPRVTAKKNEPTYGRLSEPVKYSNSDSRSGKQSRPPLSSSSSVEAEQSETENERQPVSQLISKFERSSVNEKVPLRPNDDPFARAPLSKSLRSRHSEPR